jgi:ribonucleoside-triphosphate reductase
MINLKRFRNHIDKVQKREGEIVSFDRTKIEEAIFKALTASGEGGRKLAKELSLKVLKLLNRRFKKGEIPNVEQIQDIIEEVLILENLVETAKAYILYREQRRLSREAKVGLQEAISLVDDYFVENNWEVKENSNMAFSLQGLNHYVSAYISKKYWLNRIYPQEVRKAAEEGDLHIHNLDILGAYCCGWDLYDLLLRGFGGVFGKIQSKPPKHFRTALGQVVNYFYTLQGESAGAQAFSNFDTLLAPFIRYDNLNYQEIKQSLQEFMFNCNVPTRVGFQTPFENITLDLKVPEHLKEMPVIIGGQPQKETYKEFQKEMDIFNQALTEVYLEGDATGRVFTFPIPTYNITKDFDWENENYNGIWQMTAKYGIPYFSNFINSDMKPQDARSMCCRLRLDNRELYKRGGGLFGANPLTGSIGVVTINLPRIGYLSKTKKEFFENLSRLMDIAKTSLEIKRKVLEKWTEKGLYPYSKYYLEGVKKMRGSYWGNHFSTIGIIGMNEALLNFMDVNIADKKGQEFALEVLDFMRERLVKYQEETGNLYNLEATPAEGTSYRLALLDKKRYPDIITAGEKEPFYTNSTQLPVNYTDDLFEALKLQDELQTKYTGGCIEKGNKVLTDKGLIKIEEIVKNFEKLKPLKVISYNPKKGISEWDEVVDAVEIDVKKHNKIRIIAEGGLDITTSDWHPFFVLEKIKPNPHCPICGYKVNNLKGFAVHLRYYPDCHLAYETMPKYKIVEKRADELKKGDYLLINSFNLLKEEKSNLNKDLMWLIGFFMGDGSISKVIDNRRENHLEKYIVRFFSEHLESLEKAKNILNHYFNCNVNIIQDDKRNGKLRCVSTSKKEVSKFFFDYGFSYGEKTYKISIPEKVKKNITKENIYSLLSGLAESDGHISKKQGDFEYYTVSEKLADDLLEILTISGIKVSKSLKKTRRKKEKNLYRIRIPSYEMTKIKDYFNDFYPSFKIKDKLSNRTKRQLPVLRVKKVSKTEVSDNLFYDLTTKNNHNYLAGKNTFVFIHNTVFHAFLGEAISDPKSVKSLIKTVFEKFKLPYFTLTPTFSVCPVHGYLPGEHFTCPKCLVDQPCEVYSRIVGYLRPVQQWHFGKQEEFRLRKNFKIN